MSDDLIERLRDPCFDSKCGRLRNEAADALEAKDRRITALQKALRKIRDSTHTTAVVLRGIADDALNRDKHVGTNPGAQTQAEDHKAP